MLKEEVNPEYYNLIKEFENLTGIGAVLNTSLNLHGLPIVCSPKDAIEVMENSKLDMIYFGDLLITRRTSG
jgi:carbamoyltransferase